MSDQQHHNDFIHRLEWSALLTVLSIVIFFALSIAVVLIAPRFIDSSWTSPSSYYQQQMYEVADPNLYVSSAVKGGTTLQFVHHIKQDYTLLAFAETPLLRIVAPPELEKFITRYQDPALPLKLTSQLLLLRNPSKETHGESSFNAFEAAEKLRKELQDQWVKENPDWKEKHLQKSDYEILELYSPGLLEAFTLARTDGIFENWVDKDYLILDEEPKQGYHKDPGVIYVNNPQEYAVSPYRIGDEEGWRYDPNGERIPNLEYLSQKSLGFSSRKELIELGEHIFAIEGCWYCHTDQTRTLVQDVVLNGSDSYPAPPSSANEYIYQKVTFPGTRRIGPDLSRVGVKRPSRDWHKAHFWSPKTASAGSIMPSFHHFFDNDPRGTSKNAIGIPNHKFEAIFQYLMTKGTRITAPTQAWWLGKDPVLTKEVIEGRR
jgi:cytochrome c oxidase cbb3-type subunit 2